MSVGRVREKVCAFHGVSPRDRWLCNWSKMNVNVNVQLEGGVREIPVL